MRALTLLATLAMVGFVTTAVALWVSPQGRGGPSLPTDGAAALAPDFQVTLYQGQSISGGPIWRLSDYRGRPVLVNYWAVSCPPCRAEMPVLQRVYERFKDQGFIIIGVDMGVFTGPESDQEAMEFLRDVNVTYPVGRTESEKVGADYRLVGIPTSVFIRRDGTIDETWAGAITEGALTTRVEQLIRR